MLFKKKKKTKKQITMSFIPKKLSAKKENVYADTYDQVNYVVDRNAYRYVPRDATPTAIKGIILFRAE